MEAAGASSSDPAIGGLDLASSFRYARLLRRPIRSELQNARSLCGGTLPGDLRIDDAAAEAHDCAAFSVTLVHLPATLMDEEMLLEQLIEYGALDSLVAAPADGQYVATFECSEALELAVQAEAEAAEAAARPPPWVRRASSAPGSLDSLSIAPSSGGASSSIASGGGCLSGGLSKKGKTLKRVNTTGELSTPGSGRRSISFGVIDTPTSSVPERRARYTLPGGLPAFSPGWDAPIDVADAETEAEDARGDSVHFSLSVDGRALITSSRVLLASAGSFAMLRLPAAEPIDPRRASISCELASGDDKPSCLAVARTAPPMPLSAWTGGGNASNGQPQRRSLWLEASGFQIVFDADGEATAWESEAAPTGSNGAAGQNRGVELVAVRVKRQQ